jgi:hypothetical protein
MLWYPRRRLLYWVFTLVIWVWHSIPQVIRASYHRPRMLRARAWHCLRGKIDLKTSATNLILADKQGGDRSLITLPPLALAQRSSSGPFFCLPLAQSACSEMKSPGPKETGAGGRKSVGILGSHDRRQPTSCFPPWRVSRLPG